MDFKQAEIKFKQLKVQFETGKLTEAEFKTQLEGLMVQDESGSWWMIGYESEQWYRHDGTNWVQADPPTSILHKSTSFVTPETEATENVSAENVAQEHVERNAAEKTTDLTKQNILKSILTNNDLFQTWWGRSLLGGIVGIIFSLIDLLVSGNADNFEEIGITLLIYGIACVLAGQITYPHKLSMVFLILGFLIAGFISTAPIYDEDFLRAGGSFGIPVGALLSRTLHWFKVLK